MKHFWIYTGLRLGLFLLTWLAILGVALAFFEPTRGVHLAVLAIAAIVSSALSLKLLAGPRERFAQVIQGRADRASAKFEEMRSKEDAD